MAQKSSLGNPQIAGQTLDQLRTSVQYWLTDVYRQLNNITGRNGTPTFMAAPDLQGNQISNVGGGLSIGDAANIGQLHALRDDAYVVLRGSDLLANSRQLVGEQGIVNIQDLGAQSLVIVSLAENGIPVTKIKNANFGTYTPTLTNVANLDGSTAYVAQWLRFGNTVLVSGKVDVDPTLAATLTRLGMSLPVGSALSAQENCAGVAFASGIAGQGAAIRADVASTRAEMAWISTDVTNQPMYYIFSYVVF